METTVRATERNSTADAGETCASQRDPPRATSQLHSPCKMCVRRLRLLASSALGLESELRHQQRRLSRVPALHCSVPRDRARGKACPAAQSSCLWGSTLLLGCRRLRATKVGASAKEGRRTFSTVQPGWRLFGNSPDLNLRSWGGRPPGCSRQLRHSASAPSQYRR